MPRLTWFAVAGLSAGLVLAACRSSFEETCDPGTVACECLPSGGCDDGLECMDGVCISIESETSDTQASTTNESGDQSTTSGDGDGDTTTNGDGDSTTNGDGDGDGDAGDGDGDSTTSGGQYCGEDTPILTFGPTATITTASNYMPYYIRIGDVVGDNKLEIITGGSDFTLQSEASGGVEVWVQNADQDGLDPNSVFTWDVLSLPDPGNGGPDDKEFAALVVHDLNEDFDPDLVVFSRESMHVFRHGDTTLTSTQDLVAGYRLAAPVVGEFINGGADDILYVHEPSGAAVATYVEVLDNGDLSLVNPAPNSGLSSLMGAGASADLNGDDRDDVVLIENRNEGALGDEVFTVLLQDTTQGDAVFSVQDYNPQDGTPSEIELLDFDDDADIDIVITTTGSDDFNPFDDPSTWPGVNTIEDVQLFENQGDGTFVHLESIPIADRPAGLAADDFDCDGQDDLMVSTYHGKVFFLRGEGAGFADPVEIFDVGAWVGPLESADLNNDGRPDLVWSSVVDREVVVAYQQ